MWPPGYFLSTVRGDEDQIFKYVRWLGRRIKAKRSLTYFKVPRAHLRLVRAWAQLFYLFGEFPDDLGKPWPFSGGDPFQSKPLRLNTEIL